MMKNDLDIAGFCDVCDNPVYHRDNKPGEYDHHCFPKLCPHGNKVKNGIVFWGLGKPIEEAQYWSEECSECEKIAAEDTLRRFETNEGD